MIKKELSKRGCEIIIRSKRLIYKKKERKNLNSLANFLGFISVHVKSIQLTS
jgi:hypothetical protein